MQMSNNQSLLMKGKTLHEDILHIWTPPPCDSPASLISWPPSCPPPPLLAAPCSSCPSPPVLSRARSSSSCRMAARQSSEVNYKHYFCDIIATFNALCRYFHKK